MNYTLLNALIMPRVTHYNAKGMIVTSYNTYLFSVSLRKHNALNHTSTNNF